MDIGDLVKCRYCNQDLIFEIIDIVDDLYKIRGVEYRVITEQKKEVLQIVSKVDLKEFVQRSRTLVDSKINELLIDRENNESKNKNGGKVLHVDSDGKYLELCMQYYEKLGVDAKGVYVDEEKQPEEIIDLLKKYNPDILIITGHDSFNSKDKEDVNNYKNSKFFIETVKKAREYNPSKDSLIIIAGACESNFEQLIKAGANFGSSPNRVVIHALDFTMIAEQLANTPVSNYIDAKSAIKKTISGINSMGGIESKGCQRNIYPNLS